MKLRIRQPPVGTPIGPRPGHSTKRHVGLDMEVGRRQPHRQLIYFRDPLDGRKHLAGEPVDCHRRGRSVAHGQPLRVAGDAIVQFVVHRNPESPKRRFRNQQRRRLKIEPQSHSPRRPLDPGRMMTHAFPRHAFLGDSDLMTHEAECLGPRFELPFPFGPKKGVVRLSLKSPDLESFAVELHHGFRFHPADQGLAANAVLQSNRGRVGLNANNAPQQTVVENELGAIRSNLNPRPIRRWIDQPIRICSTA